jgi:hypothetical protein
MKKIAKGARSCCAHGATRNAKEQAACRNSEGPGGTTLEVLSEIPHVPCGIHVADGCQGSPMRLPLSKLSAYPKWFQFF